MNALEEETEAERGILETRLQDLARRLDETISEAELRLGSAMRELLTHIRFSSNFSREGSSDGERTRGPTTQETVMSETETIEVQYETERSKVEAGVSTCSSRPATRSPSPRSWPGATPTSIARSSWSRRDATTRSHAAILL